MPERSENGSPEKLREKIIGLGEKSIRKSYYPELRERIAELEASNGRLREEMAEGVRSRRAMAEAEGKYRALFQTMTEMVALFELVYDDAGSPSDYRCLECNDSFVGTTGLPRDRTEGHAFSDVLRSSPPPHLDEYALVVRTGNPLHYMEYSTSTGRHYSVSVVSLGSLRFATIAADITDIKNAEEIIAAKNKELEHYLHIASHDLRAPLVNIQGFSARLGNLATYVKRLMESVELPAETAERLSDVLNAQVPRAVEFITSNVARMDRLISGLLQISRTGRIVMTVRRVDMNSLVRGIVGGYSYQIDLDRATVELDNLPDCFGDETLLVQLFENLLTNALKYRDSARSLAIRVSATAGMTRNVYCVSDTGIGIAPDQVIRIWDAFYRVDWDGAIPGEGIGLSIAKRIADKHGGRIWVESEVGKGSSFFVELPAQEFIATE